ncbi:ABC transporter transmembrane domain-containing protein [Corynebacterium hansenii]|uniref:ABC transporter transmembrane domain-containing protein n=1 Tax=Corynebacterium hansenii TaxID=394964 RepID=A0ABV7ZSK0_9CORY|nr:ABC transporter ATP-binding protein [Corynebacterium hansenii]WJY99632.1 putative ABC transporter ATP-binding protein [Corynebacterium hansenii]
MPLITAPVTPPPIAPPAFDESTSPTVYQLRVMFSRKPVTIPAMLLMIVHQVCEALVPVVAGRTVDTAIADGDSAALWRWMLVLAAVFLVLDVAARFGGRLATIAMLSVEHALRMQLTDRIVDRRGFADGARPPGALLTVSTTDAQNTARAVIVGLRPVAEVAALVFASVILLTVSVPIGLVVLVGGALLTWGSMAAGAPLRRRVGRRQAAAARASATAADLVAGFRTLAGLGARRTAAGRYRDRSREALDATVHAVDAEARLIGWVEVLGGVFVTLVAAGSGIAALQGRLTVGELITVVGLAQFIIDPMTALGKNASAVWATSVASAERVLGLLREPHAASEDGTPAGADARDDEPAELLVGGTVVPPGAHRVIPADAGEMAAIVDALTLAHRPEPGGFAVDGVDLAEAELGSVLRRVVTAPHSADLFDGTVTENLLAVRPDATGPQIDAALAAAGCADVIEVLPDGADTRIGDAGVMLSGGQRQRIALARALLADPPALVLADPTTAVDSVTEQRVARGVAKHRAGRTTVVLTSAPAWAAEMEVA